MASQATAANLAKLEVTVAQCLRDLLELKNSKQRDELAHMNSAEAARASASGGNDAPDPFPKRRKYRDSPPRPRAEYRDSPPRPRVDAPPPVVVYAGHMQPPPLQYPQYQHMMTPRRSPFIAPGRGPTAPSYAYNHVVGRMQ